MYRPYNSEPYNVATFYKPTVENFYSGIFIIDGKEYTKYNNEFITAVQKHKMWENLSR